MEAGEAGSYLRAAWHNCFSAATVRMAQEAAALRAWQQALPHNASVAERGTALRIVGEDSEDPCKAQQSLRLHLGDEVLRAQAAKVRHCLAGRSLLFVGDSITRYQYISLISLIETGRFPERCTRTHDPQAEASVVRERDWGTTRNDGWPTFYRNVSEVRLNGNEQCDCLAIGAKRTPTGKTAAQFRSCAKATWHNIDRPENRYYASSDGRIKV